jgi:hypothetical protein
LQKDDILDVAPKLWEKMCKVMACERMTVAFLWTEGVDWLRHDPDFIEACNKHGFPGPKLQDRVLKEDLSNVDIPDEVKKEHLARLPQLLHKDVVKGFFTTTDLQEYMPVQAVVGVQPKTQLTYWEKVNTYKDKKGDIKINKNLKNNLTFCGSKEEWDTLESIRNHKKTIVDILPGWAEIFHGLQTHGGAGLFPNLRLFFAARRTPRERDLDEDIQAYFDQTHEPRVDYKYVYMGSY